MLYSELDLVQLIALSGCHKVKSNAFCQSDSSFLRLQTSSKQGNSSIDLIEGGVWSLPHVVNERKISITKIEK